MVTVTELKVMLEIPENNTDDDRLLRLLINSAAGYVKSFCHTDRLDAELESVVMRMAAEDYNRCGSEGIAARSASGVSETYKRGYSDFVITTLRRRRAPARITVREDGGVC